jgi:hypothetical protein
VAAALAPMLPLAPALLSTTKVVFRRDCSSSARTRAIVSPVPLPPGAGTMSWIVLPGCGQTCEGETQYKHRKDPGQPCRLLRHQSACHRHLPGLLL